MSELASEPMHTAAHRQPYRYEPTHHAADLHDEFGAIEDGTETTSTVTVAGRLMLIRPQGKLLFATLQDMTGRVQLFAPSASTPRFDALEKLSIGDWVGVTGVVMKTRKGELSIRVGEWVVLAKSRRPFPDKWHGLTDPDTRYRQRYVDLWVSDESRSAFAVRLRMFRLIRTWLEERGFVEVDTPILHPIHSGGTALPFTTHHNALDRDLYLRVAPELYLKRLVVGGYERIFELGRSFRNEGLSPRHQPEFTNMEVYQAYADWTDMMALVEELFAHVATEIHGTTKVVWDGREVDLTPPWRRASMVDLIEEHGNVRVDQRMERAELERIGRDLGATWKDSWGNGKLIYEIYEKVVEPKIWNPTFVTEYPKEVSPLAREHRELPETVERFEGVITGRELCNAFSELTDPVEQRARFEEQARARAEGDEEAMELDEDYVRALEYGLPPTAGLGVGIDRLAMLLTDSQNIRDVTLFPTLRPEQP